MREISIAFSNSFPSPPRPHHLCVLLTPKMKQWAGENIESNLQGFSNVLVTDDPIITTSKPPSHSSPPPDTTLRKMKRENQSIKSAAQQGLRH